MKFFMIFVLSATLTPALGDAIAQVLKMNLNVFRDTCKTKGTLLREEQASEQWKVVVNCPQKTGEGL